MRLVLQAHMSLEHIILLACLFLHLPVSPLEKPVFSLKNTLLFLSLHIFQVSFSKNYLASPKMRERWGGGERVK